MVFFGKLKKGNLNFPPFETTSKISKIYSVSLKSFKCSGASPLFKIEQPDFYSNLHAMPPIMERHCHMTSIAWATKTNTCRRQLNSKSRRNSKWRLFLSSAKRWKSRRICNWQDYLVTCVVNLVTSHQGSI